MNKPPCICWWWRSELCFKKRCFSHFSSAESSFFSAAILRRPPEDALPSWWSVGILYTAAFFETSRNVDLRTPCSLSYGQKQQNQGKHNCESWKKYKPRWHDHFVPPVEGCEEEGRVQEEEGIQAWRRKTFWLSYPHVWQFSPLLWNVMKHQPAIFRAKSNKGCSENFKDTVCLNAIMLFPVIDFNFHNSERI